MLDLVESKRLSETLPTDSGAYQNLNTGFFDGLRAIAAFWVLTAHCMLWTAWGGSHLPSAKLAVDLFMIISGFLMAFNAHQRADSEPLNRQASWYKFYLRRIFRLAPAYYLALLCAAILREPFISGYQQLMTITGIKIDIAEPVSFSNYLLHVGFLFGLVPSLAYSTALPDWSLSLEAQFYLLFPALTLLLFAPRSRTILITLAMAAFCALYILWNTGLDSNDPWYFSTPSFIVLKLPVFLIGMLLCEAAIGKRSDGARFWLRMAAILMCLTQYPFYHGQTYWLGLMACLTLVLTTPLTSWPAIIQVRLSAALSNKFTRFCSDISYSVYLFHGFFIAIVGSALFRIDEFAHLPYQARTTMLWVITMVGTVAVASIVRVFVEAPGIAMGRLIVARMWPRKLRPEIIQAGIQRES